MRLCMIYASIGLVATASLNLVVSDSQGIYPLTLFSIACVAYAFSLPGMFDIFIFSALGLSAKVIAIIGLAQLLLQQRTADLIGAMVFIAGSATAMLAATVNLIIQMARRHMEEPLS